MSDNDANRALWSRAAKGTGALRLSAWAPGNAYPPGRDAIQRLAEKRIAEKRRARRKPPAAKWSNDEPEGNA